jgi:hypothetical protein
MIYASWWLLQTCNWIFPANRVREITHVARKRGFARLKVDDAVQILCPIIIDGED